METQSTLLFLTNLASQCEKSIGVNDTGLFESLQVALESDGLFLTMDDGASYGGYNRHLTEDHEHELSSTAYFFNIVAILMCIICAGLASGLTQGLLSLDFMEMTIKSRSGTAEEKAYAAKVIPVISHHHLLLATLMLWNASATEALPIFLNKLVPEYVAIIISVTLVVLMGEIIPAAILTGPNQLQLAAGLLPLVYTVIAIFFPIAWPIAKLLDHIIGHDSPMTMYNRNEISTMMALQHEEGVKRQRQGTISALSDPMHREEVAIIGNALRFRDIMVSEVMTPVAEAFMIPASEKLSYKTLLEIFKSGYSRIPVYDTDRNDIIGLILAKDLIFVDAEDETPVRSFIELFGRQPAVVWPDDRLGETLNMFRHQRGHMAIVRDVDSKVMNLDPVYTVVGIITLEDIIEEILGEPIGDETDGDDEGRVANAADRHGHGAATDDTDTHLATKFRDLDFIRLKLLHGKMASDEQTLSTDEINAVAAHLHANVPQFQTLFPLGNAMEALTELIAKSTVFKMRRKTPQGAAKPVQEDVLYRRGRMSNTCTLMLSGVLTVLAGKDEFLSVKGPWSVIAADALVSVQGTYIPDYTAYISSETARFLSISVDALMATGTRAGAAVNASSDSSSGGGGGSGDTVDRVNRRRTSAPGVIATGGSASTLSGQQGFLGAHSLTERKMRRAEAQQKQSGVPGTFNPILSAVASQASQQTATQSTAAVANKTKSSAPVAAASAATAAAKPFVVVEMTDIMNDDKLLPISTSPTLFPIPQQLSSARLTKVGPQAPFPVPVSFTGTSSDPDSLEAGLTAAHRSEVEFVLTKPNKSLNASNASPRGGLLSSSPPPKASSPRSHSRGYAAVSVADADAGGDGDGGDGDGGDVDEEEDHFSLV